MNVNDIISLSDKDLKSFLLVLLNGTKNISAPNTEHDLFTLEQIVILSRGNHFIQGDFYNNNEKFFFGTLKIQHPSYNPYDSTQACFVCSADLFCVSEDGRFPFFNYKNYFTPNNILTYKTEIFENALFSTVYSTHMAFSPEVELYGVSFKIVGHRSAL